MSDKTVRREDGGKTRAAAARLPAVDAFRSFPNVGVDAALWMVMEEREDVLSARARGANGGGLTAIGGLKDRD